MFIESKPIESKPEYLPQIGSEDLLPEIGTWTRLGGLVLPGSVGIAVALAATTQYPMTVKTTARVRPIGEDRVVEAATSGMVTSIKVKQNQVVAKGQPIATIDDSQLRTKKSQVKLRIRQNQLELSQIDAQLWALQAQINAESKSVERQVASAQAKLRRTKREYRDKEIGTQAQLHEAIANLDLAKEEMKRYQKLGNTGAVSELQIKQKEQSFKAAQARVENAQAQINPTNAEISIAQEEIAQIKARGESTLAALHKEKESIVQRRIEIENQIMSDRQEFKQVLEDLQKTIVRAPMAGTILNLELRNPSQVVNPGEAVAHISPGSAPLVVKARVTAEDISKVKICKAVKVADCQEGKVQMRVSAYPYPDYGVLKGAVREISADTVEKEQKSLTPEPPSYQVTIEPEHSYLEKQDEHFDLQAGMETTAEIISQEETVLTFLLRKARLITNV